MKAYLWNIAYAVDLFVNAVFGGERYETLSARWGKIGGHVPVWYLVCRMLHWFDREHCEKSAARHAKIKAASE